MGITHLVLSGGGVKGFATLGSLHYLVKKHILNLNKIRVFAGSSVGAIISLLLVCGYTPKELFKALYRVNMSQLLDLDIDKLFTHYGFDTGVKLVTLIKDLMKIKSIDPSITFIRLYNLTKQKLIVTATSLNKRTVKYFDYIKTPNYCVIDVIRASFGIPVMLTTVKDGEEHFVDGGLLDNFPIHLFPNVPSSSILAIKFVKTKDLPNEEQFVKINSIIDVIFANIGCLLEEIEHLRSMMNPDAYYNSSIFIDTQQFHTLNFDIDKKGKKVLFNIGKSAALAYINSDKYLIMMIKEQLNVTIQTKIWKYVHASKMTAVHNELRFKNVDNTLNGRGI